MRHIRLLLALAFEPVFHFAVWTGKDEFRLRNWFVVGARMPKNTIRGWLARFCGKMEAKMCAWAGSRSGWWLTEDEKTSLGDITGGK